MADGVIVGGKSYPLLHPITGHPIPVFNWKDTGMEFKPGDGHNKKRTASITGGVYHYTGSENSVETMFRTLNKRKLGVEMAGTPLGSLFQFCDPLLVDTADAGKANKFTWGIEFVNQGIRKILDPRKWQKPRAHKLNLGPRPMYRTAIHGKEINMWGLYPQQVALMCALNRVMVEALPDYGADVCTVPTLIDYEKFNGAMAHYNVSKKKVDIGTQPMEQLAYYMKTGKLALTGEDIDAMDVA